MKKLFLLSILALLTSFVGAQNHWTPVDPAGSTGFTATIIGVVEIDGVEQHSDQLEVGVFHGDVCRGTGMSSVLALNRNLVFISVFGLNGEEDTFKIYDHVTNTELDADCAQVFVYQDNGETGTIPNPYVISFESNSFTINAYADPAAGGLVTGTGSYDKNAPVTLTATASYGYAFTNWTKDDVIVSTDAEYTFTATVNTAGDYYAHFTPIPYEITVTANPTTGGTVSGAGTYDYGTTVTLSATPATGYEFVDWTLNGTTVHNEPSYEITVLGDASYEANFTLKNYTINVEANPPAGGTVAGGGNYDHFATCTLTATPATGYHFVRWEKDGQVVSDQAEYSFEVTGAGNYEAIFAINSYDIVAKAEPMEGGTVTGAGPYNHFEECTLVATPNTGYHFVKWTENGQDIATSDTLTFVVSGPRSFKAHFELNSYQINVTAEPAAGGTVSGDGMYNHFETCTLTATPATGYHFVSWTLNGTRVHDEPTYSFEVTDAGDYVANFEINSYAIEAEAQPTEGGTVSGARIYNHFEECILIATANTGYHFVNWTENGQVVQTSDTLTFEVDGPRNLVAHFELNSYAIEATAQPTEGGTVSGARIYNHFEECVLIATPNTGYHFVKWTENGQDLVTSDTLTFEVDGPRNLVAHFELNSYAIDAEADPTEGGTVSGANTYYHFETCTLVATPAVGYHFVNWTENGQEISTSDTLTFEVNSQRSLKAHFVLNSYAIEAVADPTTGGTVSGVNTYNHFETCSLVANPNTGYHFVKWTENGQDLVASDTLTFVVDGPRSLVAHFELNSYAIDAEADPTVGGTVSGANTYNHFETCTLIATPAVGYHFVNWTENGQEVSTLDTLVFEVTGPRSLVARFRINGYVIDATADPVEGGTITGADTYDHFETCTLIATAATGYHFVNWTENGQDLATSDTLTFEVDASRSFVAHFEINSYAITATADPVAGGAVSGANTYNHFETCSLIATPVTGYHFVKWTENGQDVATSDTLTFEVTGPRSLVAHFALNSYTIAATANPSAGGVITGAGSYSHFETCTLTATVNTGYTFVNWTKDGVEVTTNLSFSFTVEGAASYVAHFSLNSYEINVSADPTEGGTVSGGGTYDHFETCELTATANTGYTFINWTKGGVEVTTNPTFSFTVEEAGDYVAHFSLNSYTITVAADPAAGGTVSGDGTYNHFETCTLTATVNTGYHFVNWTLNGEVVSTSATYQFEVSGGGDYVAHFALNSYAITAVADPTEGGTVSGAGTYNHFETCELTATANTGYTFVNWTKGGVEVTTNPTFSFTVEEAGDYVAHFSLNSYTITVAADPAAGGTVSGDGTYNHFETCTLTATVNTGYHFVNWTLNGEVVSTSATYQFEVSGAGDYIAHFALNSYTIAATANPTAGGTITGAGTYNHFETCTLTATVNTGYTFINWTKDGVEVSTDLSISFTVEGAASYVAHFSLNSYEITVSADPVAGGTVNGGGTYNHFATCTLTATPAAGYHFVNWTKNGTAVSTSASYSFEVTEAASYVAHFAINSYVITATANPAEGGTITGAGTYNHFASCTLTATPSETYIFVNWTKNGMEVSTNPTFTFTVTGAGDYVANFTLGYVDITALAVPANYGTVSGSGSYLVGTSCTLTATPFEGYYFVKWTKDSEDVSTDATYSFVVTEEATYRAHFAPITYSITAEANPEEAGTVTGMSDLFYFNNTCQLVARANEGYTFVNWTRDGVEVSDYYIYEFTVTESAHFVANFVVSTFEITAAVDPEDGGTVVGAGTYAYGETVTMTATPNHEFSFINWMENGEVVSEEATFTFTATQDRHLVAHFISTVGVDELLGFAVTMYPNPAVDKLMVKSQKPIRQCEVYSLTGQRLMHLENCGETFEIWVQELSAGSYTIRMTSEDAVKSMKFIKE